MRDNLSSGRSEKSGTGIRGRVSDPSGKVPQGVYAFATTDPSFMIGAMPPHRSQPIGPDGSYFIEIPSGGGTFYVSARSGYGGPPLPGEWHGFFGEKTPRPVLVETGSVTGGIDQVDQSACRIAADVCSRPVTHHCRYAALPPPFEAQARDCA